MIWYTLQVRTGRELEIAKDLAKDERPVFVPIERVIRTARNAKGKTTERVTEKPLIPSYVFTNSPHVEHRHVFGPLMFDGVAHGIPDAAIYPIKMLDGRERRDGQPEAALTIGQVIRLTGGSYHGLPATITALRGDKITVVTRLFNRDLETTIGAHQVAA